jgi:hypothetical protein
MDRFERKENKIDIQMNYENESKERFTQKIFGGRRNSNKEGDKKGKGSENMRRGESEKKSHKDKEKERLFSKQKCASPSPTPLQAQNKNIEQHKSPRNQQPQRSPRHNFINKKKPEGEGEKKKEYIFIPAAGHHKNPSPSEHSNRTKATNGSHNSSTSSNNSVKNINKSISISSILFLLSWI